jgi:hypothetical protein
MLQNEDSNARTTLPKQDQVGKSLQLATPEKALVPIEGKVTWILPDQLDRGAELVLKSGRDVRSALLLVEIKDLVEVLLHPGVKRNPRGSCGAFAAGDPAPKFRLVQCFHLSTLKLAIALGRFLEEIFLSDARFHAAEELGGQFEAGPRWKPQGQLVNFGR